LYGTLLAVDNQILEAREKPASPRFAVVNRLLTTNRVSGDAVPRCSMHTVRSRAYRIEPFPFTGETENEFTHALEGAAARTPEAVMNLQLAARACVRQLKEEGMTPEGVIITMRAYLRYSAERHLPTHRLGNPKLTLEILGDQLSTWCIDEYYL
jgi:hypothetical protein